MNSLIWKELRENFKWVPIPILCKVLAGMGLYLLALAAPLTG
jgi:hypothetical protein